MTVATGAEVERPGAIEASLTDQLAELDAAVERARARRSAATDAMRHRTKVRVGVEATRELREYCDAVAFSKREPDEEEHRRLVRDLFKRVEVGTPVLIRY